MTELNLIKFHKIKTKVRQFVRHKSLVMMINVKITAIGQNVV